MTRFLMLAAVSVLTLSSASAETLQDALVAAYNSNPQLQSERAALRGTDEDVASAKSGYRPFVGSQATIDKNYFDVDGTSYSGGVNVQQNLFRGGRTRNSVDAAEYGVKIGREQLRSIENTVFFGTVSAYMDVVRAQSELELNDNQVKVLQRQLKATQDRFRVGDGTRTDVAQADARVARAISGRTAAQGGLTTSREAYRRVVGQLPGALERPAALPGMPKSVDEAVDVALQSSPQLQSARYLERLASKQVAIAKGAVLPSATADVGVNYRDQPLTSFGGAGRNTVTAGTVGATVNVPFFQSGAEYAAVRKAQQLRSQRMIEIATAERAVVEQVRSAWAQLESATSSILSSEAAVKANEIALEGVKMEQTVGSRTVLDVLDAEQELLTSRVELVRTQRNETVAAHGVLAATGQLDNQGLSLPVTRYNPDEHYNTSKGRWFGWDKDTAKADNQN
jgi:outer membrane protein